jgi:tetratricopeptide (TPR) repeat protein
MRERRDAAVALGYCRQALQFERQALARAPGESDQNSRIRMALANRMGWLADTLTARRGYNEARSLRNEEAAIYRTLSAREPASVELRDRSTWPEIGLARIEIAEGRIAQGLERLQRCLDVLDRLSEALPDNEIVIGERARVNILIAKARREARLADWRAYRDRAGALLMPVAGRGMSVGLTRYRRMLDKLDEGGK